MKHVRDGFLMAMALGVLLLPLWQRGASGASPRLDCGPVTDKSNDLPRTVSIATNPAGTGAHSLAAGLAAVASKATPIAAKVQPYNGPNPSIRPHPGGPRPPPPSGRSGRRRQQGDSDRGQSTAL